MNDLFNPTSMTQMGQVPLFMMGEAYDWMGRAKGADASSLAEMMRERQRKEQMHGADLAQKGATLESTVLGNTQKQFENKKTAALQPTQIDTELLKLASEADETEWKNTVRKIERGVLENNPEALRLYEQLPSIREARIKAAAEKYKADQQANTSRYVADVGAASREKVAGSKAGGAKIPKSPRELYAYYQYMADQLEDGPEKEALMEKAQTQWNIIQQELILKAQAGLTGKPDPSAVTGGQIPTNPAPQPTAIPKPNSKPKLTGAAAEDWVTRAMAANKGMTREQVIAEGKRLGKL